MRAASTPPELPGFEFVSLLGTGGFSDVFRYEQKLPKRPVAVKVLLLEELTPASQEAFVDEANRMAQLSAHPYIVTIYHADVATDGRPFFVMEYCSGPSLADMYKRGRFSVADALRTGIRLSSAIATAHGAGILHRDIKPANVLTNDFGWPALTDFGIASAVEDELPVHTTTLAGASGSTGGTTGSQSVGMSVPWSPPEMFGDDPQPDVRSDVFSLAATVHTLLAGRTPFEIPGRSNGTLDLIGRIERGAITAIDRDDIPASLKAVLQKGMATHRSDRYPSAAEFARALQRIELELGYSPTDLNIPNLVIKSERADATAGDPGETRVRSVATIAAQPEAPSGYLTPPPPATDSEKATRLRSVVSVEQPADDRTVVRAPGGSTSAPVVEDTIVRSPIEPTPPVEDVAPVAAEPRSRRGLVIGLASGAALLIVAIVVAIAVLGPGGTKPADVPTAMSSSTGEAAIPAGVIPKAVDGTAVKDGTAVTFAWVNPSPEDGDQYQYARSESPTAVLPLAEPTVTIDIGEAARQCVQVYILRGGQKTSEPLEICYPQ